MEGDNPFGTATEMEVWGGSKTGVLQKPWSVPSKKLDG